MRRRSFLIRTASLGGAGLARGTAVGLLVTPVAAFAQARKATGKAAAVPRSKAAAGPISNIPERVLVGLQVADRGRGIPFGMKHTASAYHPRSGRIYFTGGDFSGLQHDGSYRQETFSLDVATRYGAPTNQNAGWTLEYPYEGYGGTSVQPKHPDTVGFVWDSRRNVFWLLSGLMVVSTSAVHSVTFPNGAVETDTKGDDPNFLYFRVMTFDPDASPAQRWKGTPFLWAQNSDGTQPPASLTGSPEHRHGVYDPVRDCILVPMAVRAGNLGVFDCGTGTWTYHNVGLGGYTGVQRGNHVVADLVRRKLYHVATKGPNYPDASSSAHLIAFDMDPPYRSYDLGPVPRLPTINPYEMCFITWDTLNEVLLYIPWTIPDTSPPNQIFSTAQGISELYAYRPSTAAWETIPVVTSPPGSYFTLRSAVYNPELNLHVFTGGVPDVDPNNRLFFFRYKSLPAWVGGKPVNEWIPIPGTELKNSDLSAQLAAGLTNAAGQNIGYGYPGGGILGYSGGALKPSTSELLIVGGGGAGAWAGNDVRSLKLSDDAPRWTTVVTPSNASAIWSNVTGNPEKVPHAYMKDGRPNARHSAWEPIYNEGRNALMLFGCAQDWETDQGSWGYVDSADLTLGRWNPQGTHPNAPGTAASGTLPFLNPRWVLKHPDTDDVYFSNPSSIWKWTSATNSWGTSAYISLSAASWAGNGAAALDPDTNVIVQLQWFSSVFKPATFDLAARTSRIGALIGPYAAALGAAPLVPGNVGKAGFVYDRGLRTFLLYQDDGFVYSISRVPNSDDYQVNRLTLTGTPPPAYLVSGVRGGPYDVAGIYGRMQYVPRLGGVVLKISPDQPAYFIRTTTASITVSPPPPPSAGVAPSGVAIAQSPSGPVAVGTIVTLAASCAIGTAPISYRWSTNQTGAQITVTASATSTVTVTASNSAGTAATSVVVTVAPAPPPPSAVAPGNLTIVANPSGQVQPGTPVTLTASCGVGTAPIAYSWTGGLTGPQITVNPSVTTTYAVTASNVAGSAQGSLAVSVSAAVSPGNGVNYEGLWWSSPAGSESGWGLNVSHQGDTIFATWFTYDESNNPLWLTLTATRTPAGTFTGPIHYMTGPAFDSPRFDPSRVSRTSVGSATLAFSGPTEGMFSFTANATTMSKPIVRMEFAAPMPVCVFSGAPSANGGSHQGLWWADPPGSESGWGINLNHQGDIIFATWFTFNRDGTPLWLTTTARKSADGRFTGPLYQTRGSAYDVAQYDTTKFAVAPVGNATFSFIDSNMAMFGYEAFNVAQTKRITRTFFATPVSACS